MIVGMAGHIDHGKTALVKALTGVNTDRLAEERERGISIDLGFAYLDRPNGSTLGFVDMPGHHRFMRNMLVGASGIDFALLVVAANDGIMPQTREHLAVITLMGVRRGAVALTKCDLASEARQAEVASEVRAFLAGGSLAQAAILPVASVSGQGVPQILAALDLAAEQHDPRAASGAFRFAVDRCFSMQGSGTVVTGTVWSGTVTIGDQLVVSPVGLEARVRAIQVQGNPADRAGQGQRCGINLAGKIDVEAIARGDFLLAPSLHAPTSRIDADIRLLPDEVRPLRQWTPVRLHHGAAEIAARAVLLQGEPITPGSAGRIQLVLSRPIAATIGDHFVIRDGNGDRTMGGGKFLDLRPPQRRRIQPRRLAQLDAMALTNKAQALCAQLDRWPWYMDQQVFCRDRAISTDEAAQIFANPTVSILSGGQDNYAVKTSVRDGLAQSVIAHLAAFHQGHPQLLGLSSSSLAEVMEPSLPNKVAEAVLNDMVERGLMVRHSGFYGLPGHRLGLDRQDEGIWHRALNCLNGISRFRPPRLPDLAMQLEMRPHDLRRVLKAMSVQGKITEIDPDHFFLRSTLRDAAAMAGNLARNGNDGQFSAAQLRDEMEQHGGPVGRKVTIRMLEYFDRSSITLRRGDWRSIDERRLKRFLNQDAGTDP